MDSKVVDLVFPAYGDHVPLDHGYALFSAISRCVPRFHREKSWGIHPIFGQRKEPRILTLTQVSRVKIRVAADALSDLLPLIGARLIVRDSEITLGAASVHPLEPAATLQARIVTIKGAFVDSQDFTEAVQRQIVPIVGALQDVGRVEITAGPRRVLRVAEHKIVGYPLVVQGLCAQASIALQEVGIGGRRRMGAGVFVPPGKHGPGRGWAGAAA